MASHPVRLSSAKTYSSSNVPRHVAIIMDGNRRWAQARGMPAIYGHRQGAESVRRSVEACCKLKIRYLTLFAFSSENWRRPSGEVHDLMDLLRFYLRKEIEALHKNKVRVRVIGKREDLAADIKDLISRAERLTRENERLDLVIALNYGARDELTDAVRKIAEDVKEGALEPETINAGLISDYLYTKDIPDPDLLIRTSGEQRISNFLLWQMAYTEFVFLKTHWPEFDFEQMSQCIDEYGLRERRYGAYPG